MLNSQFEGLKALRASVAAAWALLWNAGLLYAFYLNDFQSRLHDPAAAWLVVATMGSTALLAALILRNQRVRDRVIDPQRRELYSAWPFMLIALICGFIAVATALGVR